MNVKTGHASLAQTRTTMSIGKRRGRLRDIYAERVCFRRERERGKKKKWIMAWQLKVLRKYSVAPGRRAGGGMVARNGHAYAPSTRDLHSDTRIHTHGPTENAETDRGRERITQNHTQLRCMQHDGTVSSRS